MANLSDTTSEYDLATYTKEQVVVGVSGPGDGPTVEYTFERQAGDSYVIITCDDDDWFMQDILVHGDLATFGDAALAWVRNFHEGA